MSTTTLKAPAPVSVKPAEPPRRAAPLTGLCRDCLSADTCRLPRAAGPPVLHCEEAVFPEVSVPSPFGHAVAAAVQQPEPRLRGLCVNCDNREGCTLRKSEGGIWRCEEYV